MEQVGKVARLVFYPVKSMAGIDVPELECTRSGVRYQDIGDRHWVVASSKGKCLDGRNTPRLCLVKPSFHGDMLHLDTEGMETLKVPREISADGKDIKTIGMTFFHDALGVDCGEDASRWLNKFLGKEGVRLIYAAPGVDRRRMSDAPQLRPLGNKDDMFVYHDGTPGTLMTEATVQDLNSRLKNPVKIDRFRANIIATNTSGPYVEDDWKQITAGESGWKVPTVCPRCTFPAVDIDTGKKDPDGEPLRTLKTYRLLPERLPESMSEFNTWPCIGVLLTTQRPGMVRVGDPIMVAKEAV